jgi:hypothetical protein
MLSAHGAHDDLIATLDPKAVTHSIVTHHLLEAKLGTTEATLDCEPSSRPFDHSDRSILAALAEEERPFSSVRELA